MELKQFLRRRVMRKRSADAAGWATKGTVQCMAACGVKGLYVTRGYLFEIKYVQNRLCCSNCDSCCARCDCRRFGYCSNQHQRRLLPRRPLLLWHGVLLQRMRWFMHLLCPRQMPQRHQPDHVCQGQHAGLPEEDGCSVGFQGRLLPGRQLLPWHGILLQRM